ncbi:MAG: type IV pilus assembly protein PilM [Actinomycetota bacterium]
MEGVTKVAGRTAIGLDIGTSSVRAAELSFGKRGVTLEKFGQVALAPGVVRDGEIIDPAAVATALKQLWAYTGFGHKNVALGVANQRVIVRQVDLPPLPEKELKEALPFQVQDFLPMPVDQAVLDFFPLEDVTDHAGQPMRRGLLVAAVRDMVMTGVDAAQRAGLKVASVDLTSFAVLRALGGTSMLDTDTVALVDVGSRVTNIVVHRGGTPLFVRILLMGGNDVTEHLSEALGMPLEHAEALKQQISGHGADVEQAIDSTLSSLVDEIRSSLDYFASSSPSGSRPQRLMLSGGGSRQPGLAERLEAATRLPVQFGEVLAGIEVGNTGLSPEQLAFVQPLAAVPVGLALGVDR